MVSRIVEISALLQTVGAKTREDLEKVLDNSSPSFVEYSIKNLIEYIDDSYINLSTVEYKLSIGDIDILFDYDNNCHIVDNCVSDNDGQTYL